MISNLLKVTNIVVSYGDVGVLKGVNIEVREGELVALIGPNGAGKTTLLKTISGLLRPKQGEIFFEGGRIDGLPAHEIVRKGLGHCPGRKRVAPGMTVMENLEMGAYLCKDKEDFKRKLKRVLSLFPVLEERRKQRAGMLSGGEQQMLSLGRALMSSPRMLMLDEPSLGLAPVLKQEIFEEIKRINDVGITMLLVDQDVSLALNIVDRAYLLEGGKISLEGTSEALVGNDYIKKAYLGI